MDLISVKSYKPVKEVNACALSSHEARFHSSLISGHRATHPNNMSRSFSRRRFISISTAAAAAYGLPSVSLHHHGVVQPPVKVGIIGLDTSHSIAFTKALNAADSAPALQGFRVVAAYPKGSDDIESSAKRIPGYTNQVKGMGVTIVDSVEDLLDKVDVVLLETNDGRPRLKQALMVLQAGKSMFIDKPVAGSLKDVIAIYAAAKKYNVPIFSSSSLRYMQTVQDVTKGKIGKVTGADAFSPATIEQTHPDLFWYGIHGVEILYSVMGTGCQMVSRFHTNDTDVVVGTWHDGRIGTFRGTRTGKHEYGGTAYGTTGNLTLGPFNGYDHLLIEIINFFRTRKPPVSHEETLEIYTFMEAADESKRKRGMPVRLDAVLRRAQIA